MFGLFALTQTARALISRRSVLVTSAVGLLYTKRQFASAMEIDSEYPGTAVERMRNIRERARGLTEEELSGEWEEARLPCACANSRSSG